MYARVTFFDSIVRSACFTSGRVSSARLKPDFHVRLKALAEGLAGRTVRGHDGTVPVGLRLHVQEAAQPVLGVADQAFGRDDVLLALRDRDLGLHDVDRGESADVDLDLRDAVEVLRAVEGLLLGAQVLDGVDEIPVGVLGEIDRRLDGAHEVVGRGIAREPRLNHEPLVDGRAEVAEKGLREAGREPARIRGVDGREARNLLVEPAVRPAEGIRRSIGQEAGEREVAVRRLRLARLERRGRGDLRVRRPEVELDVRVEGALRRLDAELRFLEVVGSDVEIQNVLERERDRLLERQLDLLAGRQGHRPAGLRADGQREGVVRTRGGSGKSRDEARHEAEAHPGRTRRVRRTVTSHESLLKREEDDRGRASLNSTGAGRKSFPQTPLQSSPRGAWQATLLPLSAGSETRAGISCAQTGRAKAQRG